MKRFCYIFDVRWFVFCPGDVFSEWLAVKRLGRIRRINFVQSPPFAGNSKPVKSRLL